MKRDGRVEQVRQLQGTETVFRAQVNCQMKGRDRQAWAACCFDARENFKI
jgi:hypothetical protein